MERPLAEAFSSDGLDVHALQVDQQNHCRSLPCCFRKIDIWKYRFWKMLDVFVNNVLHRPMKGHAMTSHMENC